ncbi:MAG: YfhO family protein [Rikenellaceae bacterium]
MRKKLYLQRLIPFALAVVLYALFVAIYFAPQLGGEVLSQGDVTQYRGMTQEILETRERTGEDPQWSSSMFSGMPAYLINVEYPSQIIKRWVGSVTKIIDTPAAFIFFAMLSMWLMLVMMGVGGYVAIVGGAMYGLSTYFFLIIGAGHITKMWALVYAPLMIGAIYMTLRRNMWWGAALTALFTSLEIGANHPQISYYFLMAAGFFWVSELYFAYQDNIIRNYIKRTLLLLTAGALGVLSNFAPLWYTAEHTPDTMRGGSELVVDGSESKGLDMEYATAWSYGIAESLNLLIPDFTGRDSSYSFDKNGEVAKSLRPYNLAEVAQQLPAYWGAQPFTAGPTYIGAIVLFLAALGFGLSKGRERWWVLAISIVMLMLSWGSNLMWFTELMFNILPGYNKFRTVSMTQVVLEWTAPLMAAYALWILYRGETEIRNINRKIAISAALTGGVAVVIALGGEALFDYGRTEALQMLLSAQFPADLADTVASAMVAERAAMAAMDGWRTAAFVALAALTVLGFVRKKIPRSIMVCVIGVLVAIDLGGVANRFLSYDDFGAASRSKIVATEVDKEILKDSGEVGYRVLNLTVSPFNDATTSYFHRSVGGYHGAKLARYQDLINYHLSNKDPAILDMLNTRYLIVPSSDGRSRELIKRGTELGAAWFVEGVERANSPNYEIEMLGQADLSRYAIVGKDFETSKTKYGAEGEIELVDYKPHHLTYKYNSETEALAIFSEIYYAKGWSAYIDGVESPYIRANYLLRAMELPAGEHTVEWRFRAPRWSLVEGITLAASIVILLSIIILAALKLYGNREETQS